MAAGTIDTCRFRFDGARCFGIPALSDRDPAMIVNRHLI